MKVIHIESGLGNQMLSYCEYLALQMMNPNDDIYIETLTYEISECSKYICQWNGYELDRIFGISARNVNELFSEDEWRNIVEEVRATRFWEKNWNYPVYITRILNQHGLALENRRGDFESKGAKLIGKESNSLKSKFRRTRIGYYIKQLQNQINKERILQEANKTKEIFVSTEKNIFTGQRLSMKLLNNGMDRIDSEVRKVFCFPAFTDKKNTDFSKYIKDVNSVAIHARRGDMLGYNAHCYKYGYFRRAVHYIKKHVNKPVFIFFCDPGSVKWCKENYKIFGLSRNDKVLFVDWNKGQESFRDMQLMSLCKHQIITNSSFGWWAAYLNDYSEKITISPDMSINTTKHFI